MENVNSLSDECKKQKEAFFFILRRIILASCVLLLFFILNIYEQKSKNEVINAFKNGNEVICNSSIVSIKNGYEFEKNREFFVSNGVNIFNLKRCVLK
ncbi:MAG: hypothetical protein PHE16_08665 [Aliarcobacter sp.]|nr:hypothetical protein [Aliarcobacter sp.]